MPFTEHDAIRARQDFPALARVQDGESLAFLDGPGGTQVPQSVIDAINDGYCRCNVNAGGAFQTSQEVEHEVVEARAAAADLLGAASAASIAFGANMTTLNFALSRAVGRQLRRGDEIVITRLDHEANRGPWQKLAADGVVIREVAITPGGTLDLDDFRAKVSARTRVVAVTMASNALGTVPDLAQIRALSHDVGAWLICDAVHFAAHFPLDVQALDCDFLLCSAYKFHGPHVGILYSRPGLLETLDTDCLRSQKQSAPYRIETGTPNHPALMGVRAAIDYLASWGDGRTRRARLLDTMSSIAEYEHSLALRYLDGLARLPAVTVWGPPGSVLRAPTVSVTLDGMTAVDAATRLAARGFQLWHGHFYAPGVLESLDLVARGGLLRTGVSLYNTPAEIDRLLVALEQLAGSP
jgi:cysteine desulfurase family protein (TIGR01976 family)